MSPASLNPDYSEVIVFHKPEATHVAAARAKSVAASFPKPSSLFEDLEIARKGREVSADYLKRADAADAPIYFPNLGITLGYVDKKALNKLKRHPAVASVSAAPRLQHIPPVRVAAAQLTRKLTWGLEKLEIPKLWAQGLTGKGVLVGHLDTGVDTRHPALRGQIEQFTEWNLMGQRVPNATPHDSGDHGTHTAATICGRAVDGRSVGVAPGAKLCSGLVIEGGNTNARILGGLDWLAGLGLRIISLSLGYPGYDPVFLRLVNILLARNLLPVFAIGNEGPNTSRSPGNYPRTLATGAINETGHTAIFSGSQHFRRRQDPDKPDVVSPGVNVISAAPGGGYQTMDGTSMATPHVAGVAALLLEAKPTATAVQLHSALIRSSARIKGEPRLRHGAGLIQPLRALQLL